MLVAIVTALIAAGLRDDFGLATVILCIQHEVWDAAAFQQRCQTLAFFDADGTDQDRTTGPFDGDDFISGRYPAACDHPCW